MRGQTSLISIFAAGGAIAFLLAGWNGGLAAPTPATVFADRSPNAIPVDTELVIAVDVSNSMDPEEQALQREGYIDGLTSGEFVQTGKACIDVEALAETLNERLSNAGDAALVGHARAQEQ